MFCVHKLLPSPLAYSAHWDADGHHRDESKTSGHVSACDHVFPGWPPPLVHRDRMESRERTLHREKEGSREPAQLAERRKEAEGCLKTLSCHSYWFDVWIFLLFDLVLFIFIYLLPSVSTRRTHSDHIPSQTLLLVSMCHRSATRYYPA